MQKSFDLEDVDGSDVSCFCVVFLSHTSRFNDADDDCDYDYDNDHDFDYIVIIIMIINE